MNIQINADLLCEFTSFSQWVNKATSWIGFHKKGTVICLDKDGNICLQGEDFMAARAHDLFPVRAYLLNRTINALSTTTPSTEVKNDKG